MKNEYIKVPPQAIDLEEAVLGALLMEKDAYSEIASIVDVPTFYKKENQLIFAAIKSLATKNQPIDMLIVTEELRKQGTLKEAGGPFYITQLISRVASAAHIEKHARILAQKYMARELIRVAHEIQRGAYNEEQDIEDVLQFADKSIGEITDLGAGADTGAMHEAVLKATLDEINTDCINTAKGIVPGIPTGFNSLDSLIGGWRDGTLTIIASRPGIGKTSLALNFAKVAAQQGKWVNFFSFEMSKVDLCKIYISGEADVSRNKIRDGKLSSDDWIRITQLPNTLPIKWIDRAGINVNHIKSLVRKNRRAGQCDLVIIDYLQLITPTDRRVVREQQISEMSRTLKEITLNENIPIICLSQLNREAEKDEPQTAHLRESGAIEQDADVIILPWRPGYNGGMVDGEPVPETEIKMMVKKNRRGRRGEFKIYANEEMTMFSEQPIISNYSNIQFEGGFRPPEF